VKHYLIFGMWLLIGLGGAVALTGLADHLPNQPAHSIFERLAAHPILFGTVVLGVVSFSSAAVGLFKRVGGFHSR
jgi:hypothetical protein